MSDKNGKVDIQKRKTLTSLAMVGAGTLIAGKAPYVFARNKVKLRILGTHVTLQEELRQKAMQDLGI